ncbi:hypothetical protein FQZ97_729330 [compost metagenome]
MRVLAGADRRGDGRHVEGVRPEGRHDQGSEARYGKNGVRAGLVAVVAQHQHARHVLPGQRDDEQRQRDPQQGLQREPGHFEHWRGQAEVDRREIDPALRDEQAHADDENADHRETRCESLQQRIRDHQHDHQHRIDARAAEGIDAELQQDARQQAGGDAARDHAHELVEGAGHAQHDEAQRRNHVSPDDLSVGRERHHGGKKGHPGRRPGRDDGGPVAQAQQRARDAHADGYRPDPGRGLGGRQLGKLGGLEHQDEGPPIVHQHRDQRRDGGGKEIGGSKAGRRCIHDSLRVRVETRLNGQGAKEKSRIGAVGWFMPHWDQWADRF